METQVLIDIDDVTAQFRRKFIELVNEIHKLNLTLENCDKQYEIEKSLGLTRPQNSKIWVEINKKGFAQTLEPMENAIACIDRLASKRDVYFLTAPLKSSDTWVSDRTRWVRKHFGVNLSKKIIFTKMKHMVDGDILIEDNLTMLKDWMHHRMSRSPDRRHFPVVYHWPYNVDGGLHLPRYVNWELLTSALGC